MINTDRVLEVIQRMNVGFLHVGRLFAPQEVINSVTADLLERDFATTVMDVSTLAHDAPDGGRGRVFVVYDLAEVAASSSRCELLANARAAVMRLLEALRI